jgi:hypothetical protein
MGPMTRMVAVTARWSSMLMSAGLLLIDECRNRPADSDSMLVGDAPSAGSPGTNAEQMSSKTDRGSWDSEIQLTGPFSLEDVFRCCGPGYPASLCECTLPVSDDRGTIIGIRLLGLQPESMTVRLGLINGDVIRRINGVPVDSETSMRALRLDVQSVALRTLELTRGGRELAITYRDR